MSAFYYRHPLWNSTKLLLYGPDGRLHCRVMSLPFYPWTMLSGRDERGPKLIGKLVDLMDLLGRSLNFTYEILFPVKDPAFGALQPNGRWTGAGGMVQSQEAELMYPWVQGPSRKIGMGGSTSVFHGTTSIVGSVGKMPISNFVAFLTSFDVEIWYFMFSLLLITVVLSSLSDTLVRHGFFQRDSLLKDLDYYFWMYTSALFYEGSFKIPFSRRSQFLLGTWLFAFLTFMTGFTGQFKALVMTHGEEPKIRDIQDLVARTDLAVILPKDTVMEDVLRDSPLEKDRKIFQRARRGGASGDISLAKVFFQAELYQRVKDGGTVAFFTTISIKSYLMSVCDSLIGNRRFYLTDDVLPYFINIATRRDLPTKFVKDLDNRIRWLVEGHHIEKIHADGVWNYQKCEASVMNEDQGLRLTNLLGVFYLLLFVDSFAVLCLLLEILVPKVNRKPRRY